ncbi:hypothetical protein BASA60_002908 [Batrachochytrium salamandrivorans]|nr:hypothetical protein BASA60_002908 [Batrachochytrium salamandrivorans]
MKIAAILVASLLAIAGRAAPMSELADNGLQLYKRQVLPPLLEENEPSQSDDEMEGEASNKPTKGAGFLKSSRLGAALQKIKLPGHGFRSKSADQEEPSGSATDLETEDNNNDSYYSLLEENGPSQSDEETEGGASNKPTKGAGFLKSSRLGAALQKMKLPGHGLRSKSPKQKEQPGSVTDLEIEDNDNPGPFPENVKTPQSNDETRGVKGKVSNKLKKGISSLDISRLGLTVRPVKLSGHKFRPKSPKQKEQPGSVTDFETGDNGNPGPFPENVETPQSNDETRGVKGKVSDKLAKGARLFKTSRLGAALQKINPHGHKSRPKYPNQKGQSVSVTDLETEESDNGNYYPSPAPEANFPSMTLENNMISTSGSKSTTEDTDLEDSFSSDEPPSFIPPSPPSSPSLSGPAPPPAPPILDYLSSLPPSSFSPPPPSSPSSSGPAPPPAPPISDYLSSLPPSSFSPPPPSPPSSSSPVPPPAPPLPPKNWDRSPVQLKKVVNDDDSEKSSPVSITPKTNSRPGVQRPTIDITKAKLKPTVQQPKPQYMPEQPLHQVRLRKTTHGGSKGHSLINENTDQETNAQEPSTSYQQKSPEVKMPPKVLARPNMKLVQEAREKANLLNQ